MLKKFSGLCKRTLGVGCGVLFLCMGSERVNAADSHLDTLLGEYASELDLSHRTRKESGGFLQVYTRQDLDRMQIRQLKELIEKIPFFRYKEDRYGLSDPFYVPFQPPVSNGMRIYINDRALTNPYTHNGLKLFGQLDMGYIDHVEIYLGIPSQTFGIEAAACVIKLYTKDPEREDTTLAGALLGSRGTQKFYGYDARVNGEVKYLVHASYTHLKRQHLPSPGGVTLKRDKEFTNGYLQIEKGDHRFEFQAIGGQTDAFLGDSMAMNSIDPDIATRYLYGGWFFEEAESGWKAFAYVTDALTEYRDRSLAPLGITLDPLTHRPRPYYSNQTKLEERMGDLQIKKRFQFDEYKNETGFQARYKHFRFKKVLLDETPYPIPNGYDTETILSLFSENSYMIDPLQMATCSVKVDRYLENGTVKDRTLFSGRVGYIYNDKRWTSKTFLMYSDAAPTMRTNYIQHEIFNQTDDPETLHVYIAATKLIYRVSEANTLSGMYTHTLLENALYFDPTLVPHRYLNMEGDIRNDTVMVEVEHRFDALNRLKTHLWKVFSKHPSGRGHSQTIGGYLGLTNTVGRFDIHNDLVYKLYESYKRGLDWNFALTYHHSRSLTLFLKANNILGEALKQNYYAYNPFSPNPITKLEGVDVFDKRVWAGLEYQF